MRKLLTILNAMIRDGRPWDPALPLNQLAQQHSCYRMCGPRADQARVPPVQLVEAATLT
jgi:hypothetical protein